MSWNPQDPRFGGPVDGPGGQSEPPPWASAPPPIPSYNPPPQGPVPGPQDHVQGYPQPAQQPPAYQQPAQQPPAYQQAQYGQVPHQQPTMAPGQRYADWGERAAATLVDMIFYFLVAGVVSALTGWSEATETLGGMVMLGLMGYLAWMNGSKGQTPGKALTGIKVVREADGTTLGGPVGLIRGLMLGLMFAATAGILWVLALVWPMWDPKRQALHDKVVGATVRSGYPKAKFGKEIFRP